MAAYTWSPVVSGVPQVPTGMLRRRYHEGMVRHLQSPLEAVLPAAMGGVALRPGGIVGDPRRPSPCAAIATGVRHDGSMARRLVTVSCIVLLTAACTGGGDDDRPLHQGGTGSAMEITSAAFTDQGTIPERFTCDGADVSPPLGISGLPAATESLVIVMDDPDASRVWDHWVAYDIEPTTAVPEAATTLGTPGVNSWGETGYRGPCPPSGTHRYRLSVYALDASLGLPPGAAKATVLEASTGHVLAEATIVGLYR